MARGLYPVALVFLGLLAAFALAAGRQRRHPEQSANGMQRYAVSRSEEALREADYPAYFPPSRLPSNIGGDEGGGAFETFADYFAGCRKGSVVAFGNLGGDAVLLSPCPIVGHEVYPHVAEFVRSAPDAQVDELFRRVGVEVATALRSRGGQPTWVSTSGLGVYWLHVRLDTTPKYYQHGPYRAWP